MTQSLSLRQLLSHSEASDQPFPPRSSALWAQCKWTADYHASIHHPSIHRSLALSIHPTPCAATASCDTSPTITTQRHHLPLLLSCSPPSRTAALLLPSPC